MANQTQDKRTWLGILFLAIGAFLVLHNLDIIPFYIPHFLFSWTTLLILLGVFLLVAKQKKEAGIVLIIIGSVFMSQHLGLFNVFNIFHYIGFWPLVFLGIGAAILLRKNCHRPSAIGSMEKGNVDYLDDMAIFGGAERVVTSQNFRGGRITSIFGGSDINLTNAQLADGHNIIDVFTLFGGSSIMVPHDWNVKVQVTSIFGAFDDERKKVTIPDATMSDNKVLIIKGFVMFGGGELKSY